MDNTQTFHALIHSANRRDMKFDVVGNPSLQRAIIDRVNELNHASGREVPTYMERDFNITTGYLFLSNEQLTGDTLIALGFMYDKAKDTQYFNEYDGDVATITDLYPAKSNSWVLGGDPSSDASQLNRIKTMIQDHWDDPSADLSGGDCSKIIDACCQLEDRIS